MISSVYSGLFQIQRRVIAILSKLAPDWSVRRSIRYFPRRKSRPICRLVRTYAAIRLFIKLARRYNICRASRLSQVRDGDRDRHVRRVIIIAWNPNKSLLERQPYFKASFHFQWFLSLLFNIGRHLHETKVRTHAWCI